MLKKAQNWLDEQAWYNQIVIILILVFLLRTFGFGLYQVPTGSMETTMLVGERFFADKFTIWFTSIKRGEIISFNEPTYNYSKNTLKNLWERYVWGPSNWTKRVIGLPGEHIQGKLEDGHPVVYVNGKKLDEPYLNKYPLIAGLTELPNLQSTNIFGNATIHYFSFDPSKTWSNQPFYATALSSQQLVKNLNPRLRAMLAHDYPILEPGTPSISRDNKIVDIFDVHLGENEYWVMGDNRLGSWDSRGWGKLDGKLIHGRIVFCIFSLDSLNGWFTTDLIQHGFEFFTKIVRWNRCMKFVS